ncbi:MAG: type 4a pilus biogenesis protein PilO, partial [Deltaproteobacteria bacterium]|nr:type 4a pilus biogenesis protein PilO [Deltaproteobacteria bacterium]
GPDKKAGELKGVYRELPRWEDFTRVMGGVYKKAERLNLLIESASYQPSPVKDSGLVLVTVSMPVTGSYADIKRFVYDLETSPISFIIENLSLGSGKGQEGDISLNLTIAAHFKG